MVGIYCIVVGIYCILAEEIVSALGLIPVWRAMLREVSTGPELVRTSLEKVDRTSLEELVVHGPLGQMSSMGHWNRCRTRATGTDVVARRC